ncbi:hypothetical protein M0804_001869 [Polistes exclamans]|nr:hypothetical protein M0804_001869 [Polistes exclamans]
MQRGTAEHKTFLVYRSAGGCSQTRALQMGGPGPWCPRVMKRKRTALPAGPFAEEPNRTEPNLTEPNHAKRPAPTDSTSTKGTLSR